CVLLRRALPVAMSDQPEHQWAPPPVLPQGHHLRVHSATDIAAVQAELNDRPRKSLGWRSPADVLAGPQFPVHEATVATFGWFRPSTPAPSGARSGWHSSSIAGHGEGPDDRP